MIILSTIVINMAFGDNGVVKYAESASDYAANDEAATSGMLNSAVSYIDNLTNPETATTVADAKGGNLYKNTTAITDEIGNTVYIPGGFRVASDSATKVEDGIVIEDSEGNQFVWVPVSDYTTMYEEASATLTGVTTVTDVYSKLRIRSGDDSYFFPTEPGQANTIREPDILSEYDTDSNYTNILGYTNTQEMADAMVAEYNATYTSIKKYGGFYIGRYELTGTVVAPTVCKRQSVLTNQNWYQLKKACTNVVSNSYAQSTMIYGNQWDEVMDWLKETEFVGNEDRVDTDSSSWGNYNTKQVSGYSETCQANNIYDLAGNCYEWTQEAFGADLRVGRGGGCNSSGVAYPASDRTRNYSYATAASNTSSRPALYIK